MKAGVGGAAVEIYFARLHLKMPVNVVNQPVGQIAGKIRSEVADPSFMILRVTYTRGNFSLVSRIYGYVLSSRKSILKRGLYCLIRLFLSARASLLLSTSKWMSRASEIRLPVCFR